MMNSENASAAKQDQRVPRKRQESGLRAAEPELKKLASEGRQDEFFGQIMPLLGPLKSYIKRQLRVAYLGEQIRTPVYTSGDILDAVVLRAYANYPHKPPELTLEQWLYQIANDILEKLLRKQSARDKRRRSLERMTQAELRTLEEDPITADAEGEIYLAEDLDDAEIRPREFNGPLDTNNPEEELEKSEELERLFRALGTVPIRERIIFELFAVEGFPKETVARIANVLPDDVPRIVQSVRAEILCQLKAESQANIASAKKTA
jgi:RNA polymerase sigma factor (sigma-70 family)